MTSEIYDSYSSEEIHALYDVGLSRLQQARWSFYLEAVARCVFTEERPS